MKESYFSSKLRDDIKYMLDDGSNHVPHVYLIRDSYGSGKKPYDLYFTYFDSFYAIELKVCRGKSIRLDCVMKHQKEALYEVEHSGKCGKGYVIILLANYDKYKSLVIPIYKWSRLVKKYRDEKSLKIDYLFEHESDMVHVMERKKYDNKLHWDVINGILKYERD